MPNREKITQQGVRCVHCKDEIYSCNRHDYRTCKCGKVSIDGGADYVKLCFEKITDYESIERDAWKVTPTKEEVMEKMLKWEANRYDKKKTTYTR